MDASWESGNLANLVEVERRFRRSVNLDRDAGSTDALDGYVLTPAIRRALSQITDGLDDADGDRAWSLVGPYGSGKSAFAVFLADLLSGSGSPEGDAARSLLDGPDEIAGTRQPLFPALLTAERAPLDTLLLKSLRSTVETIWANQRGAKPRVLRTIKGLLNGSAPAISRCATSDVVGCFEEAVQTIGDTKGAGLLLIVDEAGKALEFAAQQPTRGDVYLLQALAEAAARSNGAPFVILTVLHQSFDRYAHQLGPSDRNEWAKVQGRFGELAFREGGDQIIRLTAAAIRRIGEPRDAADWARLVSTTAAWVSEGTGWDESRLAGYLDGCWPLHPVTTALLGPLFRGRLAQNERSLFAFLSAGEPLSFRDFLRASGPDRLYTADRLYDYATGMLGDRVLGRDGRQWAEIDTAIRRLPPEADAVDEQVLKTVGLLGMLGDQVGLRASAEIVAACVGGDGEAERALEHLKQQSVLVFRQFRNAFQIWEGSDLDLDDLVVRAEGQLPNDFSVAQALQRQAPRTPLVARRHLFETGTLRFFDVRFVDASRLMSGEEGDLSGEGDGVAILALPRTEQEGDDLRRQQGIAGLSIERLGAGKPVVLVVPEASARLTQLTRELAALHLVRTTTPELQSDPTARTELSSRIDELQRQVAAEVERAFDPRRSGWFTGGERLIMASWRDASRAMSNLCDAHYGKAPAIRNELLNRRSLSTSAAKARRNLIEAMILCRDVEQLRFEGNPPEVSMYRSLLEVHGLHRRRRGGTWGFGAPRRQMQPVWKEIDAWLDETEAGRRPIEALYDRLRLAPFGLRDGPLPVIVVASLLAHEEDVAVYERGSFVPGWTPSLAERLLRSPGVFEVRRCRIAGARHEVLAEFARILRPNQPTGSPSLLQVVRGLVRRVGALPPYARRTGRVSATARRIRDALVQAREPAKLVFEQLPVACGCPPIAVGPTDVTHLRHLSAVLRKALADIAGAYPALVERARAGIARRLTLPERPNDRMAVALRERARNIRNLPIEPALAPFVLRATDDALEPDDYLISLLTHLADKPPHDWSDADEERFDARLAEAAHRFHTAESLAVEARATKGAPLLRLAVARPGRPETARVLPVPRGSRNRIAAAADCMLRATDGSLTRDEALTALAVAAERLLEPDRKAPPAGPDNGSVTADPAPARTAERNGSNR